MEGCRTGKQHKGWIPGMWLRIQAGAAVLCEGSVVRWAIQPLWWGYTTLPFPLKRLRNRTSNKYQEQQLQRRRWDIAGLLKNYLSIWRVKIYIARLLKAMTLSAMVISRFTSREAWSTRAWSKRALTGCDGLRGGKKQPLTFLWGSPAAEAGGCTPGRHEQRGQQREPSTLPPARVRPPNPLVCNVRDKRGKRRRVRSPPPIRNGGGGRCARPGEGAALPREGEGRRALARAQSTSSLAPRNGCGRALGSACQSPGDCQRRRDPRQPRPSRRRRPRPRPVPSFPRPGGAAGARTS